MEEQERAPHSIKRNKNSYMVVVGQKKTGLESPFLGFDTTFFGARPFAQLLN